jgi:hypothetical protein
VNGSNQLQSNAFDSSQSHLSTQLNLVSLNYMKWSFFIRMTFPPSAINNGRVYLASDSSNLNGSLNGYYLQFGEASGNDAVELFRQTGVASVSVCRGPNMQIASSVYLGVRVTRDAAGLWKLFVDTAGGTNYVFQTSGSDLAYNSSKYFGVVCKYATTGTRFFFDDIDVRPYSCNLTLAPVHTNVNCFGGQDGFAVAVTTGGATPFTYSWLPSGQTGDTVAGLRAGNYTCVVTDLDLCTRNSIVTISEPTELTDAVVVVNATCNTYRDGYIILNETGGVLPYNYLWTPVAAPEDSIGSLPAGIYTAIIKDSHGCYDTVNVTITQPTPFTVDMFSTPVTCGQANGTDSVSVSGSVPPYTFLWSPGGQTTQTAYVLAQDIYTVTITDSAGCTISQSDSVGNVENLVATSSQVNVSCHDGSNGIATMAHSGGTGPFTYLWSPGSDTTTSITGLTAGVYTGTVTDVNLCFAEVVITITEPDALSDSFAVTMPLCFGDSNGIAIVIPSGGTTPYTYLWSAGGQTNDTATGLAAATYSVSITDSNNCSAVGNVTISQPDVLSVSTTHANETCDRHNGAEAAAVLGGTAPYAYLWSPSGDITSSIANLGAGVYTINVTDANGCMALAIDTLYNIGAVFANIISHANVRCHNEGNGFAVAVGAGGSGGYSYLWSPSGGTNDTASNLAGGTYIITISDSNNCFGTDTVVIVNPAVIAMTVSHVNETCNLADGVATVNVAGGHVPYSYLWSPSGGTAAVDSNLAGGMYYVFISDAGGCQADTSVFIYSIGGVTAIVSGTTTSCGGCCDGTAAASAFNGTAPYTYLWSNSATTAAIDSLCSGIYTVTVTDSNGCTSTDSVIVSFQTGVNEISEENNFIISPNPAHGEFVVRSSEFVVRSIEIYNILGDKVYAEKINCESCIVHCELQSGIYFVRVGDGKRNAVRKLMVE